jgi:hypothetical protein
MLPQYCCLQHEVKCLSAVLFTSHSSSGNETASSFKKLCSVHVAKLLYLCVQESVEAFFGSCEISERARQSSFLVLYELWSAGN